ncbi:MAG: hypothetical protein L6R40_007338 [Gallowayella cf. fulva]|nr:MAG: hypothetical protein L6R40_007338 [Xanthomendoza cf. fulva]
MQSAPEPKSALGRYRLLAPSAALKVSPLALGTMNFGDAWAPIMGAMDKSTVFSVLDFYKSQGGNFLDAANTYQNEQSEIWLGEWLSSSPGLRDQMVVATKYGFGYSTYKGFDNIIHANQTGNGTKSLNLSLDASLKKLQTHYIDILFVHWWDFTTSIPELMHALNTVCDQGKVFYLGISDTPAWVVAKANEYARGKGLRQFVVYEGRWSAADRDFERDILSMCAAEGMGIMPWGPLGGGNFKTAEQREAVAGQGRNMAPPREKDVKVSAVLEKMAKAKGTALTSVALAYVLHKAPYVFPIVGGRKIEHLKGNIEALSVELTPEDLTEIEGAVDFDPGFPLSFISPMALSGAKGPKDVVFTDMSGKFDYVDGPFPIRPHHAA